jgi:hypothetical protein
VTLKRCNSSAKYERHDALQHISSATFSEMDGGIEGHSAVKRSSPHANCEGWLQEFVVVRQSQMAMASSQVQLATPPLLDLASRHKLHSCSSLSAGSASATAPDNGADSCGDQIGGFFRRSPRFEPCGSKTEDWDRHVALSTSVGWLECLRLAASQNIVGWLLHRNDKHECPVTYNTQAKEA